MNTSKSSRNGYGFLLQVLSFVFKYLIIIILPFFVLIRGAIFLYLDQQFNTWIALGVSIFGTSLILFLYAVILNARMIGKFEENTRSLKYKLAFVLAFLVGYCSYTLVFFPKSNAKTMQVREEFSSLHPFLRLGVGTIIFVDSDLLVTDFARQRADYKKMGLQTKKNSMHYIQQDGYAHALDLRTNGRSEARNFLLEMYFNIMGFRTLRHIGTADHLHISIPTHQNPKAL